MMERMTDTPTTHKTMTGDEFAAGLAALGWRQVEFADRAGIGAVAVNRWIGGHVPVPAWAAAHLRLLIDAAEFSRAHVEPPPRGRRKASASLVAAAPELLRELQAAHQIIKNALAVMTDDQKWKWGELNDRDGVDGEGVTRYGERAAVLTRATDGGAAA